MRAYNARERVITLYGMVWYTMMRYIIKLLLVPSGCAFLHDEIGIADGVCLGKGFQQRLLWHDFDSHYLTPAGLYH